MLFPIVELLQVYVLAPEAITIVEEPIQTYGYNGVKLIVGLLIADTSKDEEDTLVPKPFAAEQKTVYVLNEKGNEIGVVKFVGLVITTLADGITDQE